MNRADIDTERVYRCTTRFDIPGRYSSNSIIGLCKVVEIPNSGGEVLVRRVNGRLEPVGKTIAGRLSDIKIAGEHDIERALHQTKVEEADAAWAKLAKQIKADYARLFKAVHLPGAKLDLNESIPYEIRHALKGEVPSPEDITREMVEATASLSVKGPEFVKAMTRLKVGPPQPNGNGKVSPATRSRRKPARQAAAG